MREAEESAVNRQHEAPRLAAGRNGTPRGGAFLGGLERGLAEHAYILEPGTGKALRAALRGDRPPHSTRDHQARLTRPSDSAARYSSLRDPRILLSNLVRGCNVTVRAASCAAGFVLTRSLSLGQATEVGPSQGGWGM